MKEKQLKLLTIDLQKLYGRKLTVDERSLVWDVLCLQDATKTFTRSESKTALYILPKASSKTRKTR